MRVVPKYNGKYKWLNDAICFMTVHGSQAYGTSVPESDLDIKGICIPPIEYFFGYTKSFEQADAKEEWEGNDVAVYSIVKFFRMAAQCNPNIIEMLFTDPADHLICDDYGMTILDLRDNFLSRRAIKTFLGFAKGEMRKIESHRRWISNPPEYKPDRADFGLTESKILPVGHTKDIMDRAGRAVELFPEEVLDVMERERRYAEAIQEWNSYQKWVATNNKKRTAIEKSNGYDTKSGMHIVRLMSVCIELVEKGTMTVRRPDAELLLSIRKGAWSYEKLTEWVAGAMDRIRQAEESSPLPEEPDEKFLDEQLVYIIEHRLGLYAIE